MTRPAFTAAAVAVSAIAGLAGWGSVGDPAPALPQVPSTVVFVPGLADQLKRAGDRAACSAAVASGLAQIDEMQRAAYGAPEPFPKDLDPAFLPAGVEALASQVAAMCPKLGLQFDSMECTEFPCITLWRQTVESNENPVDQLEGCDAWARVPHDGERTMSATRVWVGEDGTDIRLAAIATVPPGWSDSHPVVASTDQRKTRFDVRQDALFSDHQVDLGARDRTKVERLEQLVERLEEQGHDEQEIDLWKNRLEVARAMEAAGQTPSEEMDPRDIKILRLGGD